LVLILALSAVLASADNAQCCNPKIPWRDCNKIPVSPAFYKAPCSVDVKRSGIPCATRNYFMNQAFQLGLAAGGPCPFGDIFTAVIVQHNGPNVGDAEVICQAVNNFQTSGFTGHGEMEALRNCSRLVATDPRFGPSYVTNMTFWHTLSLYTTGESCSMCMSAIRLTVLKEVIYGTSIQTLHEQGWPQISLFNADIQQATNSCNLGNDGTSMMTRVVSDVLKSTLDPYFAWQFDASAPCPPGCSRVAGFCSPPSK